MKYFVLGIDAASDGLLVRQNMTKLKSRIDGFAAPPIELDLFSRGWVDMYTGQHAMHSGGYYEKPYIDGSFAWSKSFNHSELPPEKCNRPIWEILNDRNYSVGIMNIPTTSPAPSVNGFFVAGGGGGADIVQGVAEKHCFSDEIRSYLNSMGYILDERVPSLLWERKIFDPDKLIDRLIEMNKRRVESYLFLEKSHQVDFGFLVFRSVAVVEYLACAEMTRYKENSGEVNHQLAEAIDRFYLSLDGLFEKLLNDLNPENYAVVSDHGLVPKTHKVNINLALQKGGLFVPAKTGLFELKRMRHLVPYSLRKLMKKNRSISAVYQRTVPFSKQNTTAFNMTNMGAISGIYLNDSRFFGAVSEKDKAVLVSNIVELINANKTLEEYDIKAEPNKRSEAKAEFSDYEPDIWINLPEGFVMDHSIGELIKRCNQSFRPINLKEVVDDNWTGTKSRFPMARFSHPVSLETGKDMTAVYDAVLEALA